MPRYEQLAAFMGDVRRANPTFEAHVKSSLRPLINLLQDANATVGQVQTALAALPADKVAKYREALWYLQATYPMLAPAPLAMGALGKTEAALFTRTQLAANFDPTTRPPRRHKPQSQALGCTVEQWLLGNAQSKGILLIHLSHFDAHMADAFNGRRQVDHMNTVLRIGRLRGCDLLCLHMQDPPVCAELADACAAYEARRTNLLIADVHMGGISAVYRNFAATHDHVVVMGFDADVCVNANLFGSPETMPDGSFVPPLTSLTNVISARCVLVTAGQIYPVGNQGEYGPLNMQ